MLLQGSSDAEGALLAVGAILQAEGHEFAIVVVGGSALNLLGVVDRPTRDVDIMAFAEMPDGDRRPTLIEPTKELPAPLARAVALAAEDLDLPEDWLNTGPALQWRQGLPPGFEDRIEWRRFGGLAIGLAGHRDLTFFKLYAAADSAGPSSVHYRDLLALTPTDETLDAAAEWVRSQDPSPEFHHSLSEVLQHVRTDTGGDRG